MSGFTEHRAEASEQSGNGFHLLTWEASAAMLPLVGRVAADLVAGHRRVRSLRPEAEALERRRAGLTWPERARRYELQEELAALRAQLQAYVAEVEALGVAVLDGPKGLVGFPTIVNNRAAFFSWCPGDAGLNSWNFEGDRVRRPVPAAWTQPQPAAKKRRPRRGKSRP